MVHARQDTPGRPKAPIPVVTPSAPTVSLSELKARDQPASVGEMTKPKSTAKKRATDLADARNAGGNAGQSHWLARLKTVMKRRAKAEKKPAP